MPLFAPTDRSRLWADVPAADWRDWRWQQQHALVTAEQVGRCLRLTDAERAGCDLAVKGFSLRVTPYYAALADPDDFWCPVRRQSVPLPEEAHARPGERRDPLGEESHRPVPSVVHRYADRVLLLPLDRCAVHCRHCTRRRMAGRARTDLDRTALEQGLAYIRSRPQVRDVIVSGGDPLLLSTERLDALLQAVRAIPHVEVVRVGTRVPVCNPFRVDEALARALRAAEAFVVTHFNHPKELTAEARQACERLVDHGVPVENQSVLLRRINSSARTLAELNRGLLRMRVRPYYLHQGDVAEGTEHLRTPLAAGVAILRELRGRVSGLAIPHLAVDLPGGGGKVTLQPDWLESRGDGRAVFRNWQGRLFEYPEPAQTDCSVPYEKKFFGE